MNEEQDPRRVTLAGMREGAVEELFAEAVARVIENIDDPNTEHDAKRTVVIAFTFKATDDTRNDVQIGVQSSVKLAPVKALSTVVHVARAGGRRSLREPLRNVEMDLPSGPSGLVRGASVGGE